MNISSAIFDRSAPNLAGCPDESLPEFAFIGRSNAGKSSLLNMLVGREGLAKVSATPGHTKLINLFTVNKTWRLVDLPGYGYARVSRADKSQFNQAVGEYLELRPNLCCVFALIDSGLPPQEIDLAFVEMLAAREVPFVLVFTKIDRVKPGRVRANIDAFTARMAEWCETMPEVYRCSAKTRHGRRELLNLIAEALGEATAQTSPADDGAGEPDRLLREERKASVRETRRVGGNPARPW